MIDEVNQHIIQTQAQFITNANINDQVIEIKPQLVSTTSIGKKEQTKGKRNKKVKPLIDKFDQYIPELLILLNQQKFKSVIRIGSQYQALVPKQVVYKQIHRSINHLKVWPGSTSNNFDEEVFKKFRENFGENRTQQQLCHLLIQYQCSWEQLVNQFIKRKGQLRRYYVQKDRNRT